MEKDPPLRFTPDSIIFRDVEPGMSETAEVYVSNTTIVPIKIRFILPINSCFTQSKQGTITIPPGLEVKDTIKFTAPDLGTFEEQLIIEYEDGTVSIPLTAFPPAPRLAPDVEFIDLGKIGLNSPSHFHIRFANIGVIDGSVSVKTVPKQFTVQQKSFDLAPGQTGSFQCSFSSSTKGVFDKEIEFTSKEMLEPMKKVRVKVEVVPLLLIFTVNGKDTTELDFDTIYFGQKRMIKAELKNPGPSKQSFVVLPPHDSGNNIDTIFSATPQEGLLAPNSSAQIIFVFAPLVEQVSIDDIDFMFNYFASIEVVESKQKINFHLTGRAVNHNVTLSNIDFVFDRSLPNKKNYQELTIENKSQFLPTYYEIKPVAHFSFSPSKGAIDKKKSAKIKVCFHPKSLGPIETQTFILFGHNLDYKYINLTGECSMDLNPKQFVREPIYERDEAAKYTIMHPDGQYQLTFEETLAQQKKRDEFDQILVKSARRRKEIETLKNKKQKAIDTLSKTYGENYSKSDIEKVMETVDDDVDHHYEGILPPEPPLKPVKEPYVTSGRNAMKNTMNSNALNSRRNVQLDENILIKKKYKPKPTSPAETSECSHPLTPAQQLMISASHQTMDFGETSVFSVVKKSFSLTNNLQQNVLITVHFDCDELAQSTPASQVIPPKQTAGFDITFSCKKPMTFNKTIQYTVNGTHPFSLTVQATAIPINLQLSKSVIEFRLPPDSTLPFIKEFITIINKSNAEASYSWKGQNTTFSLSAIAGQIEANKTQNIEITYVPTTHNKDEETLVLNVVGGPSRSVKCIGDTGFPKCSLLRKRVDFGLIPIGIQKNQTLRIKNSGEDDAIFSICQLNSSEIHISPMSGRIAAHDSTSLQISFKSLIAHTFELPVQVLVVGAPTLNFIIAGQSELPKVHLSNTEFDFGRLFVGSSASLEAEISNVGIIPAILFLDLSNHPEFRIEYSSALSDQTSGECNSISLVSDQCFITKGMDFEEDESVTMRLNTGQQDTTRSSGSGLIYKISILQQTSIQFNLVYQPTEVSEHSFELPITILNVISASSFHLQPIVSAEAVSAPLSMSVTALDFGVAALYDPENPHSRPIVRAISLNNEHQSALDWRFDISNKLINDIFTIEPTKGTLAFGESSLVHISFTPKAATPYNMHLPLYAQTEKDESLIGKIQFTGVGSSQMFRISHNEVSLPIVPLNVISQKQIYILNEGFIEADLRVEKIVDDNVFPLTVSFPEGNTLKHTTLKLPVILSFCSDRPLSFTTPIAICDNKGHITTVHVSCTADNSIFTTYPFFKDKNNPIKSEGIGKQITYAFKMETRATELTSRFITVSDVLDIQIDETWMPSCSETMISFLQRYLNSLVMSTQISDFPADFIHSEGTLLLEVISNLNAGKRLGYEGGGGGEREPHIDDQVVKRYQFMKKLLHNIQSAGALVSSIRPEFLLSRSDFLQLMRTKINKKLVGLDYFNAPEPSAFDPQILGEFTSSQTYSKALVSRLQVLESVYTALSIESWVMIMLQIIKIFIISRVDYEKLHLVPGVNECIKHLKTNDELFQEVNRPVKNIPLSNVYSAEECTILKWISLYNCAVGKSLKLTITDFQDLSDAKPLIALLYAHSHEFNSRWLATPEYDVLALANAFKELKIYFIPTMDDITNGGRCTLAMIAAYLFELLPHYLPKTTLEFQTSLHQFTTRTVSISNPSKAEILYRATLTGNDNFQLQQDSIVVGPNSTVDFPIDFHARTITPLTASLILMPSRPRIVGANPSHSKASSAVSSARAAPRIPIFSAPIVVDIVSKVEVQKPDATFEVEGTLYQSTKVQILINNYLKVPSNLKLYTKKFKYLDENGNPSTTIPIDQEIANFMGNPTEEEEYKSENQFDVLIHNHKYFLLNSVPISFTKEDDQSELELEFIPIELGSFRCFILLIDPTVGEILIEVLAKTLLPPQIDMNDKLKIESGKKCSTTFQLDFINNNLLNALSYAIEKNEAYQTQVNDRRFKDLIARRFREIETVYKQSSSSTKFSIVNSSPQFFDAPSDVLIIKTTIADSPQKNSGPVNSVTLTFKPVKAGEYPCKLLFLTKNDVRMLQFKGIGIAATKQLTIDFATAAGRPVKQDVPLQNPSSDTWNFKITMSGDNCFTVPQRIQVKAKQIATIPVSFNPLKVGTFLSEMTVFNMQKESTIVYKLCGVVDEPPAEQKLVMKCQARQQIKQRLEVKPIIRAGNLTVTSTIPIITFPEEIVFINGEIQKPFEFTVFAQRSGLAAGTITFTDPLTNSYIWYVVEIHVDSPIPEQTINVQTTARKCVTISIPIHNPKNHIAKFNVVLSDDDMFGKKEFELPPLETIDYGLVISPLKAMKRISSIYFFSEEDGEFWYSINIEAQEPPDNTLASLTSPIGKHSTTFILLENPLTKSVMVRVENDNMSAFQVMSKRVFSLSSREKKRIEVRYIPTTVGIKETATISFKSNETGDWTYKLTGTGKPPQPLSPIIVTSAINSPNSALVLFTNPFPYPARFSVNMNCEYKEVFEFLVKRKIFTLNSYGEEFQIPFTFTPQQFGKYNGTIIVSSLGPARGPLPELDSLPNVRWVYPIIGNAIDNTIDEVKIVRCKSQQIVEESLEINLVGESEIFDAQNYNLSLELPQNYDFLRYCIDMKPKEVHRHENATQLLINLRFSPQRPLQICSTLTVRNPLGQEWQFKVDFVVDKGKPLQTIVIESLLNKQGIGKVTVPFTFRNRTPYQAYFSHGSAVEFTVMPTQGIIEPSFGDSTDLPIEVIFAPKMYGKVLKGVLIVDTTDAQYLFELIGKTPEYVPPVVTNASSMIHNQSPVQENIKRRRNIIKENIENVKKTKHPVRPPVNIISD